MLKAFIAQMNWKDTMTHKIIYKPRFVYKQV